MDSGEMKSFSIREFFILNKLAPSLRLSYDAEELPISVKPDRQVSVTDVMALLSETYEGTEYDMTQNLKVAGRRKKLPFGCRTTMLLLYRDPVT